MKIDELNQKIKVCKRCRLAKTRTQSICGEGNLNAKIMVIAQAPGEEEDKEGRMFVGPSGKVLDELLIRIGMDRKKIYMTNLIKCMLPKYRKPKKDEIEACSKYLEKEIEIINPKVLVPLGYYATKYIFKKYGISLPGDQKLNEIYGKVFFAGSKKILPLQHPAAVLYDESIKEKIAINYHKMKVLSHDCKWYSVCPTRKFYESGKIDKKWIEMYCKGDWERCVRYQMEERGELHPDWMLPDGSIDERLRE